MKDSASDVFDFESVAILEEKAFGKGVTGYQFRTPNVNLIMGEPGFDNRDLRYINLYAYSTVSINAIYNNVIDLVPGAKGRVQVFEYMIDGKSNQYP